MQDFKRFDMTKPPVNTKWYLRPLTYLFSVPEVISHKTRITKTGVDGIKPPYILLANHNAFLDFKVATKAIFPHRANYVIAIDGFIGRENLLRNVGGICKRKFTSDLVLVRQLKKAADNKNVLIIYPEARYSLCGTTAVLPSSLGRLCKKFGIPVVTLICHGHHINSPFWNTKNRNIRNTEAELSLLFTPGELKKLDSEEINRRIVERFQYNEYEWQKKNKVKVTVPFRAEGLHKVLYKCPSCGTEFHMSSNGIFLKCDKCGKKWELTEYGELRAESGSTEYASVPDWYEWERKCVREEVEKGKYSSGILPVTVRSLPNADGYIELGEGQLLHDMNGFTVMGKDKDGDTFSMSKPVLSLYSVHIEYDYLGKYGDCVDLNTLEDTWYIYPHDCEFSVTKMSLATEELYRLTKIKEGKDPGPGLA